jgi:hypothetical protein
MSLRPRCQYMCWMAQSECCHALMCSWCMPCAQQTVKPACCSKPVKQYSNQQQCSTSQCSISQARPPTLSLQGPQLQQVMQPVPQEPRQMGHCHSPLASAAATSSPWRLRRHILLQGVRGHGAW